MRTPRRSSHLLPAAIERMESRQLLSAVAAVTFSLSDAKRVHLQVTGVDDPAAVYTWNQVSSSIGHSSFPANNGSTTANDLFATVDRAGSYKYHVAINSGGTTQDLTATVNVAHKLVSLVGSIDQPEELVPNYQT